MFGESKRRWTFSLAMLFQEMLLVAVVLACFRLLPSDEQLRHSLNFSAYWRQIFLLTCMGVAAGAAVGRLNDKMTKGSLIGLGLSLPAAIAWTYFVFVKHAMVT